MARGTGSARRERDSHRQPSVPFRATAHSPTLDMHLRWVHHVCMGLIQLRDVPDDVHRTLKARAAADGRSLSDYILREVERLARTPTPAELDARIAARGASGISTDDVLAAREADRR